MTDDPLRVRLVADRKRTEESLALLRAEHDRFVAASQDSNADDEHDPEGATIAYERAQLDALTREAAATLADVDAALARLDAGTYGVCVRCGARIPDERLEIRPSATTCVACAAATAAD